MIAWASRKSLLMRWARSAAIRACAISPCSVGTAQQAQWDQFVFEADDVEIRDHGGERLVIPGNAANLGRDLALQNRRNPDGDAENEQECQGDRKDLEADGHGTILPPIAARANRGRLETAGHRSSPKRLAAPPLAIKRYRMPCGVMRECDGRAQAGAIDRPRRFGLRFRGNKARLSHVHGPDSGSDRRRRPGRLGARGRARHGRHPPARWSRSATARSASRR